MPTLLRQRKSLRYFPSGIETIRIRNIGRRADACYTYHNVVAGCRSARPPVVPASRVLNVDCPPPGIGRHSLRNGGQEGVLSATKNRLVANGDMERQTSASASRYERTSLPVVQSLAVSQVFQTTAPGFRDSRWQRFPGSFPNSTAARPLAAHQDRAHAPGAPGR